MLTIMKCVIILRNMYVEERQELEMLYGDETEYSDDNLLSGGVSPM